MARSGSRSERKVIPAMVETPAETLMRESLLEHTAKIERMLSLLPRLSGEHAASALAEIVIATAHSQLLLVRLLTKSYH